VEKKEEYFHSIFVRSGDPGNNYTDYLEIDYRSTFQEQDLQQSRCPLKKGCHRFWGRFVAGWVPNPHLERQGQDCRGSLLFWKSREIIDEWG
jgi:hypothetical protein